MSKFTLAIMQYIMLPLPVKNLQIVVSGILRLSVTTVKLVKIDIFMVGKVGKVGKSKLVTPVTAKP